ncbi:MAG: acetyl-CoA carboxylase biotin carboxyl carrier protein [Chlorobi bacterium]|nr:acetyl-CoA carboxylase biotin carboxyl carrier protein [Chlorobiota bacterium]
MDLNLLKRLIRIVERSEITEFEVEEGDLKVKISKNNGTVQQIIAQPQTAAPQAMPMPNAPAPAEEAKEETKSEDGGNDYYEIRSPIVGTFYRAPAPDADPYVQVGDTITPGSVLCIVEAMKLMNEIESDVGGKIVRILTENATPVEFNQPLFLVEKD